MAVKLLSDDFPYSTPSNQGTWKAQVTWLLSNFGPIGERWEYHVSAFHFKTEKDRLVFQIACGY
jgi:hypothetical protein